jgi:uncharacterized protein YecT (DUF1311 family)
MQLRSLAWIMPAAGLLFLCNPAARSADDDRYGPEYQTCKKGNTHEIEVCVGRLTDAWDRRLDAAYQKLLQGSDAQSVARLREAQRLWLEFRNANCLYYGTGEGTITRLQAAECLRSMTAHRALELEELLSN